MENRYNKLEEQPVDDVALIKEILDGNTELFEVLVTRYKAAVYYLLNTVLKDRRIMEDCCQETFMRAFLFLKKYRSDYRFTTWLLTIARNVAIDANNKSGRLKEVSSDLLEFEGRDDPEIIRLHQARRIERLLENLEPLERTIIVLRFYEDLSYGELSLLLNMKNATIRSRYHRALQKLKLLANRD